MKKYLIFDLDWTLIKSQKVLLELVSNYLKENFWIENKKSKYFLSSTRGMPLFEQIKEILGFNEHKAKEIANDIYKKIENTEKGNFFLWVPAKIKELRKNYKLFLSTWNSTKFAEIFLIVLSISFEVRIFEKVLNILRFLRITLETKILKN